jgi:hypothetical protein
LYFDVMIYFRQVTQHNQTWRFIWRTTTLMSKDVMFRISPAISMNNEATALGTRSSSYLTVKSYTGTNHLSPMPLLPIALGWTGWI